MADLYIAEYRTLGTSSRGTPQTPPNPPVAEQKLAIGAGSVQSSAFSDGTVLVRLHCDAVCSVAFGSNPTATSSNMRLAANQTEFFAVEPGAKVAVIENT